MKEISLPSGAVLKVDLAPFPASKALYQAFLEEARGVPINSQIEFSELVKNLFCVGFASRKIEMCLKECLKRATYNSGNGDLKIDDNTFEPAAAREDYFKVCFEVAIENITPFTKSLSAELNRVISMIEKLQA